MFDQKGCGRKIGPCEDRTKNHTFLNLARQSS